MAASFAIVFHNNRSYFIHHQSCFHLSKKNFHLKDINAIINFSVLLMSLTICKSFRPCQDRRNYASTFSFKQLPSFSQACHFVHQNMGHLVRLRVYNCSCFQLNRPEQANPEPLSLAMYTTFPSSLNTNNFRFTPEPGVLSAPHLLHMHELHPATLFLWWDLTYSTQHTSGLWHTSKSSHFDLLVPSHSLFTHSFSSLQADNIHFKAIP